MFGKGSKLYSIFKMKCPSCHEGDFYINKNPYNFKTMATMHKRCPVCNQNYEPEPNFYYGSMYVSYGYTTSLFLIIGFLGRYVFDWGLWTIITILTVMLVLLGPYLFRLSRITYLNLFTKYKKPV